MNTIKTNYKTSQVINKSIFISQIFPISSSDEAKSILNNIKKEYYDANHNCYAYIYGDNGEFAKNSDDGEPSQTAGVVIFDVLKKNDLTNVLAVVTRYFGGIKLGAGGLVRAYSSSTSLVLKEALIIPIIKTVTFKIICSYQNYNIILKSLNQYHVKEISKNFNEKIELTLELDEKLFESIKTNLIDITKNQIEIIKF